MSAASLALGVRNLWPCKLRSLPGMALCAAVAGCAYALAQTQWARDAGVSVLTLSIFLGIIVGNTGFPRVAGVAGPGVDCARTQLLRAGIVLYGFRITFQQISSVGVSGLLIDAVMLGSTFLLAVQLGTRLLRLDRQTSLLIGAGSAICGAAAILAAEGVVKAQAHRVSVAVATVVVFGTISMVLYPILYPYLGMSPQAYGIYAGSTVHEVAQVVVAGRAIDDSAAATAVIEKMLRVMMLAPFLVLLARWVASEPGSRSRAEAGSKPSSAVTIPWFAVLFIAVCGLHSLELVPATVVGGIVDVDTGLLAMAMAGLGMRTHAGAIRDAGVRPLLLACCLFLFLVVGGFLVNRAIGMLFGGGI